ncbi:MAG: LysM peptidoglycan-binding domain-containing protein, partial [Lachnospiraceae bacterium]|nr:LysM peptidoglycan-binding domain-containing protein [Lachnospiraceae bacterium]
VYAAGTGKDIQLGASAISDGVNTSSAQTVYYDSSSDTWRVIGYGGGTDGVASSSGTLTLIASGNISYGAFDSSYPHSNNYSGNNLKSMIETIAGRLSTEEKAAAAKRTLEGGSANYGNEGYDNNKISGEAVSNAVMWPLSAAEANDMNSDLRKANPEHPDWANSFWWLRSPGCGDTTAALVDGYGDVRYTYGVSGTTDPPGARPAFNLNLSSIIFTSAAEGGKDAGDTIGTLKEVGSYTGNEWKLTILVSSRNDFTASADTGATVSMPEGYSSWTVPITYSEADTGDKEYVSVILTNSSGVALYYGHIANDSMSGTASVTIPAGLTKGSYTLKVFSEECNGDEKTDLSSPIIDISLTVTESQQVTTPTPSADEEEESSSSSESNPENPNLLVSNYEQASYSSFCLKQEQGSLARLSFNTSMPAGYSEAYTLSLLVNDKADYSLKTGKLVLMIPEGYRRAGRSFALLGLNQVGQAICFMDTDTSDSTLTTTLNLDGYAFMLVYKDGGASSGKTTASTGTTTQVTGTYTVRRGDTLSVIAKKFKTTVKDLADKNNIKNWDWILEGQVLRY